MRPDRRAVEIIAHRGASFERPENTLSAVLRALELGVDAIEVDVHATSDGILVVHHDPTMAAVRDEGGPVTEVAIGAEPWERIRGFIVRGEPVSTLAEVLSVVAGRVAVYVEIKDGEVDQVVVETIQASPAPQRCAVHSFDHRAVKRIKSFAPEIATGILVEGPLADPGRALADSEARDYWQSWEDIDPSLVRQVHEAGGRLIAWTPSRKADLAHLAKLGVDGLCLDDPRDAFHLS